MKKRVKQTTALCAVLLSLAALTARAQFSVGVDGGYDRNYLITNVSNLVSTQYNPLAGFNAEIPIAYKVTDWLSIKTAPGYMQKSYQYARTGFYQGVYEDFTNGYIQLPLMAQLSFGGEKLRGYVNLGGYGGYWLTAHVTGRMPNILDEPAYTNSTSNAQPNNVFDEFTEYDYNEKYQFNSTKDKRLEFGVLAGVGIGYQVTDKYKFFAEANYYDGLTDQQKKYELEQVPRYNTTYVFSVGIMYSFGGNGN